MIGGLAPSWSWCEVLSQGSLALGLTELHAAALNSRVSGPQGMPSSRALMQKASVARFDFTAGVAEHRMPPAMFPCVRRPQVKSPSSWLFTQVSHCLRCSHQRAVRGCKVRNRSSICGTVSLSAMTHDRPARRLLVCSDAAPGTRRL